MRHFPLVDNFQRCRWSNTRKALDQMSLGALVFVPDSEFNNATTSITRLQEAYESTRRWRMKKIKQGWRIERTK